jgi:ribose 5-phosphate isomerase A
VVVADEAKLVAHLGTLFPLPVEIIDEARTSVTLALAALGAVALLREAQRKIGPVITDNGHLLLDCTWAAPVDSAAMEEAINRIPGVLENGFFTRNRPTVFVACGDGSVVER